MTPHEQITLWQGLCLIVAVALFAGIAWARLLWNERKQLQWLLDQARADCKTERERRRELLERMTASTYANSERVLAMTERFRAINGTTTSQNQQRRLS